MPQFDPSFFKVAPALYPGTEPWSAFGLRRIVITSVRDLDFQTGLWHKHETTQTWRLDELVPEELQQQQQQHQAFRQELHPPQRFQAFQQDLQQQCQASHEGLQPQQGFYQEVFYPRPATKRSLWQPTPHKKTERRRHHRLCQKGLGSFRALVRRVVLRLRVARTLNALASEAERARETAQILRRDRMKAVFKAWVDKAKSSAETRARVQTRAKRTLSKIRFKKALWRHVQETQKRQQTIKEETEKLIAERCLAKADVFRRLLVKAWQGPQIEPVETQKATMLRWLARARARIAKRGAARTVILDHDDKEPDRLGQSPPKKKKTPGKKKKKKPPKKSPVEVDGDDDDLFNNTCECPDGHRHLSEEGQFYRLRLLHRALCRSFQFPMKHLFSKLQFYFLQEHNATVLQEAQSVERALTALAATGPSPAFLELRHNILRKVTQELHGSHRRERLEGLIDVVSLFWNMHRRFVCQATQLGYGDVVFAVLQTELHLVPINWMVPLTVNHKIPLWMTCVTRLDLQNNVHTWWGFGLEKKDTIRTKGKKALAFFNGPGTLLEYLEANVGIVEEK